MPARIEAAAALRGHAGALALSDAAARSCLARAGRRAEELDLLVNAGLYKEDNMAEPALASLIQEDIGANPGHPPRPGRHGTFSFDVMNGGCGVVTALQLVDGFVGPGSAGLGLIVAADADPQPHLSRDFPFPPVGGAILLAHQDGGEGFAGFEVRTFPEEAGLFEARVGFEPGAALLGAGRSLLEIHQDPRFAAACVARAVEVAGGFLDRHRLRPEDVDVLVASAYPPGFAESVASALRLEAAFVPPLPPALAGAHTAGPIAALAAALDDGRLDWARNVLFVTAGAGVTIGVALYRP
jgi:3-oxoacyl-[acyl-carrier-protein] synthase-3